MASPMKATRAEEICLPLPPCVLEAEYAGVFLFDNLKNNVCPRPEVIVVATLLFHTSARFKLNNLHLVCPVIRRSSKFKARRCVVDRTRSWINRYRRVLIRWEKKPENYIGMLHLTLGCIAYQASGLFLG